MSKVLNALADQSTGVGRGEGIQEAGGQSKKKGSICIRPRPRPRPAMRVYKLNSIFPLPSPERDPSVVTEGRDRPSSIGQGEVDRGRKPARRRRRHSPPHQSIKARRLPEGKICIPSRSSSKKEREGREREREKEENVPNNLCCSDLDTKFL